MHIYYIFSFYNRQSNHRYKLFNLHNSSFYKFLFNLNMILSFPIHFYVSCFPTYHTCNYTFQSRSYIQHCLNFYHLEQYYQLFNTDILLSTTNFPTSLISNLVSTLHLPHTNNSASHDNFKHSDNLSIRTDTLIHSNSHRQTKSHTQEQRRNYTAPIGWDAHWTRSTVGAKQWIQIDF